MLNVLCELCSVGNPAVCISVLRYAGPARLHSLLRPYLTLHHTLVWLEKILKIAENYYFKKCNSSWKGKWSLFSKISFHCPL